MSENQNIQSGSIIALSSLQPFVITSGEPEMRVWLYRIDPFTGVKSLLFSSVLSLSSDRTGADAYRTTFRVDDIVSVVMRTHRLTFADFIFEYSQVSEENPDYTCSFSVLHDLIPAGKDPESMRFLTDFPSRTMNRNARITVSVFSMNDFRFTAKILLIDGSQVNAMRYSFTAAASPYTHIYEIPADLAELAGKAMTEAGTKAAAVIFSITDQSGDTADQMKIWLTDQTPAAELDYTNQYLIADRIHSFGSWSQKSVTKSSVANVDGQRIPYDIEPDNEITVTTGPLDSMTALRLAALGQADPAITIRLFAGAAQITRTGIITASEIEISPDQKEMSRLKLTIDPGKRPSSLTPAQSRFTDHFTSQFN